MATPTNEQDVQTPEDSIPTGEFSEDELEGLSDEERAALADDEPESKADDELEAVDDQEKAAAEASDEGEGSKDSEASQDPDEAAEASGSEEIGEPDPKDLMKDPGREVGDLEALDGKLSEIDQAIKELDAKVADGEIDLTDHIQQTRELQDAKLSLTLEKQDYIRNQKENQRESQIAWDNAIDSFYAAPENKRFDHPDNGGDELAFETMRNWLMKLQEKEPGRTPAWYLAKAKSDVTRMMGGPLEPEKPTKKERRKSALDTDLPKTLAGAPTAANNSVEGEFSHLDKLDGEDLEAAVAAMTPAQMDRWARQ